MYLEYSVELWLEFLSFGPSFDSGLKTEHIDYDESKTLIGM
jgi:hypothetical protein